VAVVPFAVAPGVPDLTHDVGFHRVGSITGRAWEDLDGDGKREGGEPAVPNATVRLRNRVDNTVVAFVVTQGDGTYAFQDVVPGDYAVEFGVPGEPPYEFTWQDEGGDDTIDSDPDSAGRVGWVSVRSGQTVGDVDAGYARRGTIKGWTWADDGDGVQRAEPAMGGVAVTLYNWDDQFQDWAPVDETKSDSKTGKYAFEKLWPGKYSVHFAPQPGFAFAPVNNAGNDVFDSDADVTGYTKDDVTVSSGEVEWDWDAGYVAAIGDFVWEDLNGDGLQGGDEPGLKGVKATLEKLVGLDWEPVPGPGG
jgi:hypothetical protein